MQSRRDFLAASIAAVALSARRASAADPTLGLIFPPKDYPVPPEATRLYPAGVKFLSRGIGLERLTPDAYDAAIPKVIPAAESLVREGATAISVMGTSLTFYKGRAFNENLTAQVRKATGVPVTTMSTGIVDGLHAAKAKRIAVATCLQRRGHRSAQGVPRGVRLPGAEREGLGYEQIPAGGDIIDNR
jgi:arylmalonate decarboxylase